LSDRRSLANTVRKVVKAYREPSWFTQSSRPDAAARMRPVPAR